MLENTNVKEQYTIGSSATFDFGVRFFSPGDLSVYEYNPNTKAETELTSGTDYSIEEKADYSSGAKVTLLEPLTSGNILTIVRTALPVQGVALPNFGKIPSESLEEQLDRTIANVQQLTDTVQLTMRMPYGASATQTPEEYMSTFVSSAGGGGGGGGGGSSYEFSSEFNVTSGGSVSINQIDKDKIGGLDNAKVGYASSAGYTGPFAILPDEENEGKYKINGGIVYAGGSSYNIVEADNMEIDSQYVYLVMSSGGGSVTSSYTSSPTGYGNPDVLIAKIGGVHAPNVEQLQYGNITCVPWGAGGSASGGSGTRVDFTSGETISVVLNGSGSKYTTGAGDETYTHVGSGLGGVLMGNIFAPEGADDTWTANLSIGSGSGVTLLQPLAYWVSSGTTTYGVTYHPRNAYVFIPIDAETTFFVYVNDRGVGSGTNTLKFYPRVPLT